MFLASKIRNENLVNTEITIKELEFFEPLKLEKKFTQVNCKDFSFIKISIYTGTAVTLKVEFCPSKNKPLNVGGTITPRTLVYPTTNHNLIADHYKFFVLPVEGEGARITLTPADTNDTKTYMSVSFSNNFHYCSND